MEKVMPKRLASAVMNSLKGGVVPRVGLEYIAVGRVREIDALLHDIELISDGGAAFRFIVGRYGAGKSFLLQIIRNYAMERGFVLVDADLSPERKLQGANRQGLATYKELIRNMSTKTRPDGGALPLILEKWISTILSEVTVETQLSQGAPEFGREVIRRIHQVTTEVEGMVNGFDFAQAIVQYWEAYNTGDDQKKSQVLKWFRGEYMTRTEARRELGINLIVTDDNWYDFIKIFALFLVKAGYSGMLVLIDELKNVYEISNSITRQNNYEKMLTMYNDAMQGKARHIGIIMSGTPQCIEDTRRGVYSYEALRSRLGEGRFAGSGVRDMLAPVIRLDPLTNEELFVLIEKLSFIHRNLYGYDRQISQEELLQFLKIEYGRVSAETHITPREIIRDFIELLNIAYQTCGKSIAEIMGGGGFSYAPAALETDEIQPDFAGFEV